MQECYHALMIEQVAFGQIDDSQISREVSLCYRDKAVQDIGDFGAFFEFSNFYLGLTPRFTGLYITTSPQNEGLIQIS